MRLRAAVLLCLLIYLVAPAPARAEDCDSSNGICQALNEAKSQAAQNQRNLEEIKQKINDAQVQMRKLKALIGQIDGQIQGQQVLIDQTGSRIDDLLRQMRFTDADIVRRQADLDVRQHLFDQRVRAMDKQGSVRYVELIVTSADFNQLVDRVVFTQEIVHADRRMLDGLQAERAQVEQLLNQQQAREREQEALLAQQRQQKNELEANRKVKQDTLAQEQALEAQYQAQRQELERQQSVIQSQISDLQAQYEAAARGLGGGTGQFLWPEGSRNISQGFGCSDLLGEPYNPNCPSRHYHTGIDLAGPYGTPIYAADAGIISLTGGWGGGYGNYAIIVHGNSWSTLYGHMSSFAVSNGPVQRGQVIGYEGSTGYSTGPHLHFEIRYNNVPQNPCSYLGC